MNTSIARHALGILILTSILLTLSAKAITTVFFDASQQTNLVASRTVSDLISSEGYLFDVTRDKLFTGGIGLTNPIGRSIRVPWPQGMEAQAVTSGPVLGPAKIILSRQDGLPFAIQSFNATLLANTAGAGGSIEIMPLLNGEDGAPNPYMYDATGYAGRVFNYATPELVGFDAYKITLYVDFALTALTVFDASIPPPSIGLCQLSASVIQLSWPVNAAHYTLESSTVAAGVPWTPVTNSVVTNVEFVTVDVDVSDAQRFFRLKR